MPKILPKPHLPRNATLATVVDGLAEPEEYVRRIFAQMGKQSESLLVRVSIVTDTEAPDYIFDECMEEPEDPNERGPTMVLAAFNGRTHKMLTDEKTERPQDWSGEAMSWKEVQDLLIGLRYGSSPIATAVASMKPRVGSGG
jgi:hypothetical protein